MYRWCVLLAVALMLLAPLGLPGDDLETQGDAAAPHDSSNDRSDRASTGDRDMSATRRPSSADVADLAVLEDEVASLAEQTASLSARLQKIALDPQQGIRRRGAVAALGRLGDDESIAFLARHLTLGIPLPDSTSRALIPDWHPCAGALQAVGWRGIPMILSELDKPDGAGEREAKMRLSLTTMLLRLTLGREAHGREVIRGLIQREIEQADTDQRRAALQALLDRFSR